MGGGAHSLYILCALCVWIFLSTVIAEEQTVRYTYDVASRLTTVTYDKTSAIHYVYDQSGNRLRRIVVGPGNPYADYNTNSMNDLWELYYFRGLAESPTDNPDGDAYNNYQESRAFTDPMNSQSYFHLNSASNGVSGFTVVWDAEPYVVYRVWWTEFLNTWLLINSVTSSAGFWTDTVLTNDHRYYRISVVPE